MFNFKQNNNTSLEDSSTEEIQHRVEEKRNNITCSGCGCRTFSCLSCLSIIFVFIGFIYIVAAKPMPLWVGVVEFLNSSAVVPAFKETSADEAKSRLEKQITQVGENKITIEENDFTAIIRNQIPNLAKATINIEPGVIKLYWDMESSVENNPLHGVVEIAIENRQLVISKVGFERFGTPAFLNNVIANTALSFLNKDNSRSSEDFGLLYKFLTPGSNITIENLSLEKDKAVITIKVDAKLF